jgi:hypothetical protein
LVGGADVVELPAGRWEPGWKGVFTLILKYQLYPISHKKFAEVIKREFKLHVDAPRALYGGTIQRFVNWHEKELQKQSKSL